MMRERDSTWAEGVGGLVELELLAALELCGRGAPRRQRVHRGVLHSIKSRVPGCGCVTEQDRLLTGVRFKGLSGGHVGKYTQYPKKPDTVTKLQLQGVGSGHRAR